jgi:hypothetical protein
MKACRLLYVCLSFVGLPMLPVNSNIAGLGQPC